MRRASSSVRASPSFIDRMIQRRIETSHAIWETMDVLRIWRKRHVAEQLEAIRWKDDGFVFTNAEGQPLHLDNIRKSNFGRICRRARLGTFGVVPPKPRGQPGPPKQAPFTPDWLRYCLRHTYATLSLQAGVSPHVVSRALGHASVGLTLSVYARACIRF